MRHINDSTNIMGHLKKIDPSKLILIIILLIVIISIETWAITVTYAFFYDSEQGMHSLSIRGALENDILLAAGEGDYAKVDSIVIDLEREYIQKLSEVFIETDRALDTEIMETFKILKKNTTAESLILNGQVIVFKMFNGFYDNVKIYLEKNQYKLAKNYYQSSLVKIRMDPNSNVIIMDEFEKSKPNKELIMDTIHNRIIFLMLNEHESGTEMNIEQMKTRDQLLIENLDKQTSAKKLLIRSWMYFQALEDIFEDKEKIDELYMDTYRALEMKDAETISSNWRELENLMEPSIK